MFALMLAYSVEGIESGDFVATIVPLMNVAFYGYGLYRFVGITEAVVDLLRPIGGVALAGVRGVLIPLRLNPRPVSLFGVARGVAVAMLALIATLVPVSLNRSPGTGDGAAVSEAAASTMNMPSVVPVAATLRLDSASDFLGVN
jgi:hypothetical protein